MSRVKISFAKDNKLVWFTQSGYQKTNCNEPRKFVYLNKTIYVENRDLLSDVNEKDCYGKFINPIYGPVYYKPATMNLNFTEKEFKNNKPFNPSCIQTTYNGKPKIIESGNMFYVKDGEIVVEHFDVEGKIIN